MASSVDLVNIPEQLRERLSRPERSFKAHRELAPQYSFGRHRGPAPRYAHHAAVLIALVPDNRGNWSIPLTLRPKQMVDHAGQISLPGGRAESGETVWRTACREFGEELGCSTEYLQPIGQLQPLYVYASRHQVIPMVSICSLRPTFKPNPEEVAELIHIQLETLIADDAIVFGTMQRGLGRFEAPGFRVGEHFVWGATAMILGELRHLVRSIISEQPELPWFL